MTAHPDAPMLVVLAAGVGSRYGGSKQLDGVGPGGATLMDYAVYDAMRARFRGVVFIIRPDMEAEFAPIVRARYGDRIEVHTVHQRSDDGVVPMVEGRTKPWGTGHALLAAEPKVPGRFAVVNADDFYGAEAFEAIARALREGAGQEPPMWALAGYRLKETVSPKGAVTRAVCTASDGWLTSLEETSGIAASGDVYEGRVGDRERRLTGDTLVSMNCWGFTRDLFPLLRAYLADFLKSADMMKGEFLLPDAVARAIAEQKARVRVLDPRSRWFGLTHASDREAVADQLRGLVKRGAYPEKLW